MGLNDFYTYDGQSVLITGRGGYIGSRLTMELMAMGAAIKQSGRLADCSWATLLEDVKVVFHLAAETNLEKTENYPVILIQNEYLPTLKMLECASGLTNPPRIIFAGTVTQYGNTGEDHTVTEAGTCSVPQTFYDVNKQAIETALRAYHVEYGLETATLRLANVYGPSLGESGEGRGFVNRLVEQVLNGDTPTIPEFLVDKYRDYVYVDDVVEAFIRVGAGNKAHLNGSHYIVATGESHTFHGLFNTLEHVLHTPIPIKKDTILPRHTIDHRSFVCYPKLIKQKFDWGARVTLEEGLAELIKFYS